MGKVNGKVNAPSINSVRKQFQTVFGKPLEDYSTYQRATEGLKKSTVSSMRRSLPAYFLYLKENPDLVIVNRQADILSPDATQNERYERATKVYAKLLLERGLAGYTVSAHVGRIQGFYRNNGRKLRLELERLKIPKTRKTQKASVNNEQVRKLYAVADCARDKLIVALMYQHGRAPADVAPLKIGEYPVEPWSYFETSRAKNGEKICSVSTPDVCDCLKAYSAIRKGTKGEPLFLTRQGVLDNSGVSEIVAGLIVKAGFGDIVGFKPYSLRDSFEDALCDALIYSKTKEALMGHASDIEHFYGGRKKAEENCIAAMRKTYPILCLNDNKNGSELKEKIQNFVKVADERVTELSGEIESLKRQMEEMDRKHTDRLIQYVKVLRGEKTVASLREEES